MADMSKSKQNIVVRKSSHKIYRCINVQMLSRTTAECLETTVRSKFCIANQDKKSNNK